MNRVPLGRDGSDGHRFWEADEIERLRAMWAT